METDNSKMEKGLQILVIEDKPGDAELLQEFLAMAESSYHALVHARSLEEGLRYLSSDIHHSIFDAVLLDLSLPAGDGTATINSLTQINSQIPIIVLTGLDHQETAIRALRAGAQDYLIKGKANEEILTRTIQYSIERKRLHNKLLSSEERYELSVRGANDGLWDWDLQQRTVYYSPRWKSILGYEAQEISNCSSEWLNRVHPNHQKRVREAIRRYLSQQDSHLWVEHQIQHKNGRYIWSLCRGIALWDENNVPYRIAGSLTDITQSKYLEQKLFEEKELAMVTLKSIGDAVITTDAQGCVESLNPAAEKLTGWTSQGAKGKLTQEILKIVNEEDHSPLPNPVELALKHDQVVSLSNHPVLLNSENKPTAIDDSTAPIHSSTGEVIGSVIIFHDVSEARGRARQLSWQANHDFLTKLLNRAAFSRCIEDALVAVREGACPHVLCMIDLDHFKVVNDTCGHAAGDDLLRQIADLIQDHVRKTDAVARLGGDEFAILLRECPLEKALKITNSICNTLSKFRFARQSRAFKVGSSIGLSIIDGAVNTVDAVMKSADAACYEAKRRGRNRVCVYHPEEKGLSQYSDEIQWFTRLSEAIERNRFQLFYQPIAGANVGADIPRRCEVLLRLIDEQNQIVSPAAFIPAAERFSLMPEIDRWVVRRCFEHIRKRHRQSFTLNEQEKGSRIPRYGYSINLSAASIDDDRFLAFVQEQLAYYGVPAEAICFEITETAAISNLNRAVDFIRQLKRLGCQFALDDFGTGMSSLAYLRALPVNYLKIDGSFIQDIAHDEVACAMVQAVNQVAHLMGLQTVAEFVSDQALLQKVRALGVDYIQGYAIAKPSPLSTMQ